MKFLYFFGRNLLYVVLTCAVIALTVAGILLPSYVLTHFVSPDYRGFAGGITLVASIIVIGCAAAAYEESGN